MKKLALASAMSLAVLSNTAAAESCGGTYKIKSGDTLSQIADYHYKDARKWSAVHSANLSVIGEKPNRIRVGQTIQLPCINGLPVLSGAVARPVATQASVNATPSAPTRVTQAQQRQKIAFLTADDYAPFTDRKALRRSCGRDC